jgi:predicted dehydrogenase
MAKTIKVGVITNDQGAHLDAYLAALAKTEEADAVVLADPSGKAVDRAKMALGEKLKETYKDAAEMLRREQPQMALVSLEAALAPPVIEAALDAGCHVFTEKPSCVRAEDFEPLVRKAEQKHRYLMLALANRTAPPVRTARHLIQEGKLGKVYGIEIHIIADQTRLKREAYRASWVCHKDRAGGGHLIWLGIHWLDLGLHLTGLKVRQVAGFTTVVGGQPIDVEDSAAVSLRLDNGCLATLTSGYYLDHGYHQHIQVWGEHGWLRLGNLDGDPVEWYSTRNTKEPKVERWDYPKGQGGYTPFARAAVRACAGLEPAPITGEECLHVLRTIFAAYKAAQTGQAQAVP